MTMEDLYEQMKRTLRFLDIRFQEMDKVDVSMRDGALCFNFENEPEVRVKIPSTNASNRE